MTGPKDAATGAAAPAERQAGEAAPRERLMIPAVDGFRGLAVLMVVLYHVSYGAGRGELDGGIIRNVILAGYTGVDLFFVISGFLLFLPTVISGGRFGNVRAYAVRRMARILPAYYIVLVATVVVFPLVTNQDAGGLPYNSGEGLLSFIFHLGFLQHTVGIALGFPEGFLVHGAVWTLSLEVCFYIVLPLVAARYYRRPFLWLTAALAISLVWRTLATHAPMSASWLPGAASPEAVRLILVTQFPTYLVQFGAGMTAAWAFVKLRRAHVNRLAWITVPVQIVTATAAVLAMRAASGREVAATAGVYEHWTGTTFVALMFAVLLLATVLAPRWAQLPMTNPVARRLGDISYGVYLWHLLFIGLALYTLDFTPDGTVWAFVRLLAFVMAGSVVAGWLSLVLVERPAIRWGRRKARQIEAAARRVGTADATAPDATAPNNIAPDTTGAALRPEPA